MSTSLVLTALGVVALSYLSFLGIAASDRSKPVLGGRAPGALRRVTLGPTIFVVGIVLTVAGMVCSFFDSRASERETNNLLKGGDSWGYVIPAVGREPFAPEAPLPLSFYNTGDNPLSGLFVNVTDESDPNFAQHEVEVGTIPPRTVRQLHFDPPLKLTKGAGNYLIQISALNGTLFEGLQIGRGAKDAWAYSLTVITAHSKMLKKRAWADTTAGL